MNAFLGLSRFIDAINERVGRSAMWLLLAAVLISTVNAIVRKAFNWSSNGLLEIQWYLFAGAFLLGAAYTLLHNEHVRIDVVSGKFSRRTQTWIEVIGSIFFLLPFCAMVLWTSVPWFLNSLASGETSSNAGGLILWPAKILVPIGFTLLTAQGISELIKRLAFLKGLIPDPTEKHAFPTAEENLIEELKKRQEEEAK
ncbi:MAG TPA: TRAP transporter small permease subunit [Azospira sp.]|nr:TRAP transporter small permease subunit [Azospira sp.]HNN47190.1 TRAP transporter small permease subunit [Azospira sp.]